MDECKPLRPGQLASIIATISDWHENTRDVLVSIEEKAGAYTRPLFSST